ncbi:LytTR family transcriptional regulator DNA-binding domain-containing protein [Bacteroidales bacterium OttesenSCG-928-I21]|nr:LytTR family transcriptional regulator DNA-binding domain-containing protein [Bacteroidales bacterium OttesenSCG-928-I21]
MKILIIDDEFLAIQIIREYLEDMSQVEILGEFQNGFDGLKAINELKPDLIFLDIQMPKLTGFEMLELLESPPLIIFTTAYEEYALKAFEKNAIDYLLKPFSKERFGKAMEKAQRKILESPKNDYSSLIESVNENKEQLNRIVVKEANRIFIIPISEIYYIESADDYIVISTVNKEFVKHGTMKFYEKQLTNSNFVRIHRSTIINIDFIKEIQPYSKDTYSVIMKNGKSLKTSRQGSSALKNKLKM